jgi:hypothetical protein
MSEEPEISDAAVLRSLVEVTIGVDEDGQPVLMCLCDCATATALTLVGLRPDSGAIHEFAYTCDGCLTSHWHTLAVAYGPEAGGGQ